jgi:hypothetical protein
MVIILLMMVNMYVYIYMVGGWPQPLWQMMDFVSWGPMTYDDIPNKNPLRYG